MKTYEEILKRLTPLQRKKVQVRAITLTAEEKSLRNLRQAIEVGRALAEREVFEPDAELSENQQVTDSENNSVPADPQETP